MINKKEKLTRSNLFSLENALLENVPSCLIATDAEGYVQICNPAAKLFFNFSEEFTLKNEQLHLVFPRVLKGSSFQFELLIRQSLQGNTVDEEFYFLDDKLGNCKAKIKITPLILDTGEVEGLLCVLEKKINFLQDSLSGFELLMQFVEDSSMGMTMLDKDLKFLAASENYYRQIGIPSGMNIVGQYFTDIHPTVNEEWSRSIQQVLSGKTVKKEEELIIDTEGIKRWVKWYARPWSAEEAGLGGILLIIEDITERKHKEEVLKENELLLRAVNYASSQFLSLTNFQAAINNTLKIIGVTTKVDRICVFESIAQDEKDYCKQKFIWSKRNNEILVDSEGLQEYEKLGIRNWFLQLSSGNAIKGSITDFSPEEQSYLNKNNIISVLVIPIIIMDRFWGYIHFANCSKERTWSDLEENFLSSLAYSIGTMFARNETEKKLVDTTNYLNHIFNSVPIPIFVKDTSHRFTSYNKAWAEFTGVGGNELIGKSDLDIHPKEHVELFWAKDIEVFASGKENICEEVVRDKEGHPHTMITRKTLLSNHYGEKFLVGTMYDVTDFKKVQSELQNSKDYLNNIINAIVNPIFVKDAEQRFLLINDAFCSKFSITKEEVVGKKSEEVLNNFLNIKDNNIQLLSSGTSIAEEKEMVGKEGNLITFIIKLSLFLDEKGKKYIVGSLSDISELKRKERELRNSKNYLNSIINAIPTSIFVKDRDHKFILVNEECCNLNGVTRAEILGKTDYDLYEESVSEVFWEREEEIFQSEKEGIFEEVLNMVGVEKHLITKKALFKDEFNQIYLIGTNSDITDRKKAEEIIAIKSQILNGILTYIPVVVFRIDSSGNITESLGSGWKALGVKDYEVTGQSIFEVYPGQAHQIKSLLNEGGFLDFDASGSVDNKEWHYRTFIFKDEAPNEGLIGFGIDVTEAKLSEIKQKEYSINLEKSNKELDQFAYVVSHDLKAPLRAIANLSEWIEEDLGENISEEVKKKITLLRGRVYRLQALINGILDYSKISRTKSVSEEVKLSELIDDVIGMLGIPENMSVVKASVFPKVISNRLKMEQVFTNLISNSIKYHDKPTGTITIECKEIEGLLEISVSDDGPGIPKEFHEKIFQIFQTLEARDKIESTGVGLTIVKKIIEEQGGNIRVESEVGKGTTFIFTLPKKVKTGKTNITAE